MTISGDISLHIEKRMTMHLSEEDVKKIVAEYLTRKGYNVVPADVTLSVGTKFTGYGKAEHEVTCFKECSVEIKGEEL